MKGDQLRVLLEEYRVCSSALEKHSMAPYQVLLWCVLVAGGLAAYASDKQVLGGLICEYGLALAVVGVAFVDSVLCGLGLRLVELEILINQTAEMPSEKSVCWYSRSMGSGFAVNPGYRRNMALVALLGISLLVISLASAWSGLTSMASLPEWEHFARVAFPVQVILVTLPVLVIVGAPISLFLTERETNRKKTGLLMAAKANCGEAGDI